MYKESFKIVKMLCFTSVVLVVMTSVIAFSSCRSNSPNSPGIGGTGGQDIPPGPTTKTVKFILENNHGKLTISVNGNENVTLPNNGKKEHLISVTGGTEVAVTLTAKPDPSYVVKWPVAFTVDPNDPNKATVKFDNTKKNSMKDESFELSSLFNDMAKLDDWSAFTPSQILHGLSFDKNSDKVYSLKGLGFGRKKNTNGEYDGKLYYNLDGILVTGDEIRKKSIFI